MHAAAPREAAGFIVLLIVPAVLGLAALVGGILLLRRGRDADASPWTSLWAVLLLLLALGVGGCYAKLFLFG